MKHVRFLFLMLKKIEVKNSKNNVDWKLHAEHVLQHKLNHHPPVIKHEFIMKLGYQS